MAKIRLENVTFAYDRELVIQDLSLQLKPGLFYGVVGPNGAGKSTLLKLIDGYITPYKGTVYLNERKLQSYSLRELSGEIALIPRPHTISHLPWKKWFFWGGVLSIPDWALRRMRTWKLQKLV